MNQDLLIRYKSSLRGVIRENLRLKRQVKYRLDDVEFCGKRNYKIELLNIISANLRSILQQFDRRHCKQQRKFNPVVYRWDYDRN